MRSLHKLLKVFKDHQRAADAVGFGAKDETNHVGRIRSLARAQAFDEAAQTVIDLIESEPRDNLELLERVELLRKCNLHDSERHPDRIQRERSAGAADCCARLLATFAGDKEGSDADADSID